VAALVDPGAGTPGARGGGIIAPVAPNPAPDQRPAAARSIVDSLVGIAQDGAALVIRPEAAAAVATGFGFPILLAILVLMFLVIQPRFDDRDPKLRRAPGRIGDLLVAFEDDPR
jgi:hypothetical protein